MASHGEKFTEEHQDFVLKLKIKAADGTTQIRRVRLPRIADQSGGISYDELVGLVVTFTFPDGSPDNYSVSLTYFDVDEDTVTIASTDELVDAIEQFAGKKILRISTEVKPKTRSDSSGPSPASAAGGSNSDQGVHPQVQNVLESFVGILATAVSSLQEGLATPENAPQASAPAATTAPGADNDEGEVTSKAAPPRGVKPPPGQAETNTSAQGSHSKPSPPAAEENAETTRPFIHGRHTCDSCLTTPIIGKRYNAKNLPDYDLCANCHKNYKGNEVQFEAVELDRDRAFQDRWHRRRARIQKMKSGPGDRACGRGRRRFGRFADRQNRVAAGAEPARTADEPQETAPPASEESVPNNPPAAPVGPPPLPPPPPYHQMLPGWAGGPPPPPPHGPPPHAPPHWAHIGPHVAPHLAPHMHPHMHPPAFPRWPHPTPPPREFVSAPPPPQNAGAPHAQENASGGFDDALKEAIRRSLRDIAPKETEASPVKEESTPAVQNSAASQEAAKTAPPSEKNDIDEEPKPEEESCGPEPDAETPSTPRAELEEPDEERSASKADVPVEAPSSPTAAVVETPPSLIGSDSQEEVLSVDEDELSAPTALPATPKSSTGSRELEINESFASDAVGNGDVAEAMGATLDMVAGVISEMLSEADAHNKMPPEEETGGAGELIVDSVKTGTVAASNEESEWQFVKPDTNEEDDDADEDNEEAERHLGNEIGRAAEMLGSALFNSDMQSSAENVSTLSSDSFSVPSTVPSITSGSKVAAAQRTRWSAQLATLRELGFEEALCIETLERLKAANIGVGSEDEISVTQVVNAIMEQK